MKNWTLFIIGYEVGFEMKELMRCEKKQKIENPQYIPHTGDSVEINGRTFEVVRMFWDFESHKILAVTNFYE